jgi:TRAP-type C4-dicarboxylate transport system permease small subunit
MIKQLAKIDEALNKTLFVLVEISLVVLLILLSAQVSARYFRIQALAPQDEIINLFFAWFVFVGIALLFREDGHLRVEFVDDFLSSRGTLLAFYQLFSLLVRGVFIAVLFSSSLNLYLSSGPRTSPMLHLPQRMWYGAILFSAMLMSVHCIVKIIIQIRIVVEKLNNRTQAK